MNESLEQVIERVIHQMYPDQPPGILRGTERIRTGLRQLAAWCYRDAAQHIRKQMAYSDSDTAVIQWGLAGQLERRAEEAERHG